MKAETRLSGLQARVQQDAKEWGWDLGRLCGTLLLLLSRLRRDHGCLLKCAAALSSLDEHVFFGTLMVYLLGLLA